MKYEMWLFDELNEKIDKLREKEDEITELLLELPARELKELLDDIGRITTMLLMARSDAKRGITKKFLTKLITLFSNIEEKVKEKLGFSNFIMEKESCEEKEEREGESIARLETDMSNIKDRLANIERKLYS